MLSAAVADETTGSVEGYINYDYLAAGYLPVADGWRTASGPFFLDADGNGVRDAGEVGAKFPGPFSFSGLQPGTYTLRVTPLPGWAAAAPAGETFEVVAGETTRLANVLLHPSSEVGSVTGTLFYDDDMDGVLDPGEEGLAGAWAYLDLNANSRRDTGDLQTITDFNGHYNFPGLAPGTYRVRFEALGLHVVSPAVKSVTVDGTTPADPVDFGFALSGVEARIDGRVYRDNDGDGAFDAAVDTPVPNVTVFSDRNANGRPDPTEPMGITDAAGRYGINSSPGGQRVTVSLPPGWALAEGQLPSSVVTSVALRAVAGPDFRIAPAEGDDAPLPAGINGFVFSDRNADGVRGPFEAGVLAASINLPGSRVYMDVNGDGLFNSGEPSVAVPERGHFAFGSLPAGQYALRMVPQTGYAQTKPLMTALVVDAAAGAPPAPAELGWVYAPATVSGVVYLDLNRNGIRDDGEPPALGLAVALDTNGNGTFDDTVDKVAHTEINGSYSFTGLTPGNYAAALFGNARYVQSEPAGGAVVPLSLGPLQRVTGLQFGAARWGGVLAGTFFGDADRDGVRDPSESPLGNGLLVRAEDVDDPARTWSTRADNSGAWSLDVPAGTYRVSAEIGGNIVPSGTSERVVTVAIGQDVTDIDFGFRPTPVRIQGVVYNDTDGDRVRDEGEPGVPGIAVTASGQGMASTVVTDADGRYDLADLDPGVYSVSAAVPPRMLGDDKFITVVATTAGEVVQMNPIRVYTPTSHYISGTVFEDLNGNGRRDEGEPPRWGVPVTFDRNQNGVADSDETVVSDAAGWYAFTGIDARESYRIRLLPRPGAVSTRPPGDEWLTVPGGEPTESYPDVDLGYRRLPPALDASVFYNNSAMDGFGAAAGQNDDAAIAPDKRPLFGSPGDASIENVTSYSRGINGVMIDLGARAAGAAPPTADDFEFTVGVDGDPATWPAVPSHPEVLFRPGAGVLLADRVTLTFADGAVRNTWLRVTVLPSARTGLTSAEAFMFGNLVGDTGDGATTFRVNALDLGRVKQQLNRNADALSRVDLNRDGRVNALDLGIVKANLNRSLPALTPPPVLGFSGGPLVRTGRAFDELLRYPGSNQHNRAGRTD